MGICNQIINFNFSLPPMNFCGCSLPFLNGWNFSPMQNLFGFGNFSPFGCCGGGFGSFSPFFGLIPFFRGYQCTPTIFSMYNKPYATFNNSYNQLPISLPQYQQKTTQELWQQASSISTTQLQPLKTSSTPSWNSLPQTASYSAPKSLTWGSKSTKTYSSSSSGSIDNSYVNLSQAEAERKAKNDSNLEKLNGGSGWSVADTFETDIPYAKKGTSSILSKVSRLVGENLVITSALGTAGTSTASTPHQIGGYASHHNAENPKLDIEITSRSHGEKLAKKLWNTGYFNRVSLESDHLDVQIKPEKFKQESLSITA